MSKSAFKAVVLGVRYDDRAEYEKAARAAGFRSGASADRGGRTGDWKVGLAVGFRTSDGKLRRGQVWSKHAAAGFVILALDGGEYARVATASGQGRLIDALGHEFADASAKGAVANVLQVTW